MFLFHTKYHIEENNISHHHWHLLQANSLTREQRGGANLHPLCFSIIFVTRGNLKIRSKPVPQGSNSRCFGVPCVNLALSSTWRDPETKEKSDIILCQSIELQFPATYRDIIPTATPTFATRADLNMTMSMSADVADYGFKMAVTKPELEITFKR